MNTSAGTRLPAELASELERRFFWWEPIGSSPRTHTRILAQAMNLALFDDIRRLEQTLGPECLARTMLEAQPGWFDKRSWELWRGRLSRMTDIAIPDTPPHRSFDGASP
jgi:hypothetical protein